MAGQQRFEASLLVELVDDMVLSSDEQAKAVERIWPSIQKANSQCPAHAKVSKSKNLVRGSFNANAASRKGDRTAISDVEAVFQAIG